MNLSDIAERLIQNHTLSEEEYRLLIENADADIRERLAEAARAECERVYGKKVFLRGLIEIGNICKNDCLYCGIRRSNKTVKRYRLTKEDILACAAEGHRLGFRTFVLQGGEDAYYSDEVLTGIVKELKRNYPDCAVTLSLGERSRESYEALKNAGADRYLLRHETIDPTHYEKLHPQEMSHENRLRCLRDLKKLGFQTGCGFMVGSPYQTTEMLAREMKFIESFRPEMCGIGPFIPHHETPFRDEKAGSVTLTCLLLSIIRLIHPHVLLPATTALGTLEPNGREKGILSGANVVMPNLSPVSVRKQYELYDRKICTGEESAQCVACLGAKIRSIGYDLDFSRGDYRGIS